MNNKLERAKKNLRGKKGFSLVELIIVIAIMAALVAILAPQYTKYVEKSRVAADDTIANEILTACKVAASDPGVSIGADITIKYSGAAGTITFSPDTNTAFNSAVKDALGIAGSITSISTTKSAAHKSGGATPFYNVTVDYTSGADATITVTGVWAAS